jgi:hypothetical protein
MLRPLILTLVLLPFTAASLLAGLRISPPQTFPPQFEPAPLHALVELTANDGMVLATYFGYRHQGIWEAVRLDADGDALDIPPLALGRPPENGERLSGAVTQGSGWLVASRRAGEAGTTRIAIERISREGTVSLLGELTAPGSGPRFELAGSQGSYAALIEVYGTETSAIVTFDSSIRGSAPLIVDGIPVDLAAGRGGFAALFRDRLLIFTPEPRVLTAIPLPPLFDPKTIVPFGNGFVVIGVRESSIDLLEIRETDVVPLASIPAMSAQTVEADSAGDSLLVLWTAGSRLYGARGNALGLAEGPVDLGERSGAIAVEGDDSGWLTTGWNGSTPGVTATRRILRTESLTRIADDIDPVRWIVHREFASAIATSGDTALAVWERECESDDDLFGCQRALARLLDVRGEPLGPSVALPPLDTSGVAGRDSGFLIYGTGPGGLVAYEWDEAVGLDPTPIVIAPWPFQGAVIECAGEVCLAAWRLPDWPPHEPSIRVARIVGRTVLDPGGIAISHDTGSGEIGLASDGTNFLVAWTQGVSGGAIGKAALVDPSGSLDYRAFGVTAVSGPVNYDLDAIWTGSLFEVFQSRVYPPPNETGVHRVARIRPDGSVVAGEESAWEGWPLEIMGEAIDAFRACGASYFASLQWQSGQSAVFEIADRSAHPIAAVPVELRDIACFGGGGCLGIGHSYGGASSPTHAQVSIVPMSCERERLLGR